MDETNNNESMVNNTPNEMMNRITPSPKILYETLPNWSISFTFLCFLLTLLGSLGIIFFAPTVKEFHYLKYKTLQNDLIIETPYINLLQQEITINLLFKENNFIDGLFKDNLEMNGITIYGKNNLDEDYKTINSNLTIINKILSCGKSSTNLDYYYININDKYNNYFCNPITIYRDRFILYNYLKIEINNLNLNEINSIIRNDVLFIRIETINKEYTIFESIIRLIYVFISLFIFIFYLFYLIKFKKLIKMENILILFYLIFLFLFNNPFYLFTFLEMNIFPFLNIFFNSLFISYFLFFILMMTDLSNFTKNKNTNILLNLFLSLIFYLFLTITLLHDRFETYTNIIKIKYNIVNLPIYGTIRLSILFIGIVICYIILYNIFKYFEMNKNYKFKMFYILTLLVIALLGTNFIIYLFFNYANNAITYLAIFPLFNFYGCLLTIYFIPVQ
ncbi:hypothetical protein ABK040_012573 [Willaertia magna]